MNLALSDVWTHMRDLGLGALAHANRHAAYAAMENKRWPELSVLQAAHAAELLIKARIAEEHPLLVFEKLPRSTKSAGPMLDVQDLFRYGRTLQWADLPERLWAATGLVIPNQERFDSLGQLRNGLQHFAPPTAVDASEETLRFVFKVIDPFINDCWGLFAITSTCLVCLRRSVVASRPTKTRRPYRSSSSVTGCGSLPWCTTRDLGPQLSCTHGFEVPHEHFQTHSAEVCEEGLSREELA